MASAMLATSSRCAVPRDRETEIKSSGGAPPARLVGFVAIAVGIVTHAAAQPVSPLSTSVDCRASLDAMLRDPSWLFMNNSFTRWCRVKLENEMSRCCSVADFSKGRAESCSECMADCVHEPFAKACEASFGKACTVIRKPFYRKGAPGLEVTETFCVPEDCTNAADIAAIMPWYSATYKARRNGWHEDYDEVTAPACDDGILMIILICILCVIGLAVTYPLYKFCCVPDKVRGRTLVSMEEMQQESAAAAEALEDADKKDPSMQ